MVDLAFQSHKIKIKSKKMTGVKEYGPFLGSFLSLFNIAFKTYDSRGKFLYINRKSFCAWLTEQENQERINQLTKKAFTQATRPQPKQLTKRASRVELQQVLSIFKQEMKKLSLSLGGYAPNLLTVYEVMKEELNKTEKK